MFSLTSRPSSTALGTSRDPFSLMDAMLSDWFGNRAVPALVSRAKLEVSESAANYEVRAELPGANKEDIRIDIDGAWVSISAEAGRQSEKKDGEKVIYSERSHEAYARSFELPQAVDAAQAVAKFDNGVLTLTLPKKDAPRAARIAIA